MHKSFVRILGLFFVVSLFLAFLGSSPAFGADSGSAASLSPVQAPAAPYQPALPIRAAFFYPWYPNAWSQKGYSPYTNYTPSLGLYSSTDDSVIDKQLKLAAKAHFQAFISSWWGPATTTDRAFKHILARSQRNGSPYQNLRWTIYYEQEGQGDPSVSQIVSDLTYLATNYFNQPGYLRVNDRPVVFVFGDSNDGCAMADRWTAARRQVLGGEVYLVFKVFPMYGACVSEPEEWHQYSPAAGYDQQGNSSASVSPGYWRKGDAPRLARDPGRFESDIKTMVASGAHWQLVTTWNEWGEGTAVEPAKEWGNTYIDILCRNLPGTVPCTR